MNNVKLYKKMPNDTLLEYQDQPFLFSAGEPHINITDPEDIKFGTFVIQVNGGNLSDLGTAFILHGMLHDFGATKTHLFLPYFSASRMDRATATQPYTLQYIASLINFCNFDSVITVDPHSEVIANIVDRLVVLPFMPDLSDFDPVDTTIIAPDAGAAVRAKKVAAHYKMQFVQASKNRDPDNNFKVTGYSCTAIETGTAVVIDDICDGGGTFLWLQSTVKHHNLHLFVTHGIFSRGLEPLLFGKHKFQTVSTTDSISRSRLDVYRPSNITKLLPLLEKHLNELL